VSGHIELANEKGARASPGLDGNTLPSADAESSVEKCRIAISAAERTPRARPTGYPAEMMRWWLAGFEARFGDCLG